MTSVIIRIALRYIAALLVARGVLDADSGSLLGSDPELVNLIQAGVGLACGIAAEGWYWIAKRFGWAT